MLDGVYRREGEDRLRFVPVPAPSTEELKRLVQHHGVFAPASPDRARID